MILAKVSLGRIIPLIRQAPAIARPVMQTFVRDSARTLISSSGNVPGLVQVTPPHGGTGGGARGNEAKKLGEAAVSRDVRRVYATPGHVFTLLFEINPNAAKAFYAMAKKKKWAEANALLSRFPALPPWARQLKAFDDGTEHARRRNPRTGKVGSKVPTMLIANAAWIRRYIKDRQKNVGKLAASIPAAYNGRYGPLKGMPAWISRHTSSWADGFVNERPQKDGSLITLGMDAGSTLNREAQRRFNAVLGYRLKAMQRQLPYLARVIEARMARQLLNA